MPRYRTIVNVETGATQEIEIDNAWLLENRPKTVLLSLPQLSFTVGQSASLSAQLRTPELADFSYQNLNDTVSIELQVGDVTQTIQLLNGQWADTVQFNYAGTYIIRTTENPSDSAVGYNLQSNILEVMVS